VHLHEDFLEISPSFPGVMAMSPLQYQKGLHLSEARRLILAENQDATTAAFQVGYESPSQFSWEYGRFFYLAPCRYGI